jgi:hypothetical protein
MMALAPTFSSEGLQEAYTLAEWTLSFSIMGRTNDAVLPDPVRAIPTTSRPSMIGGIVFR